MIKLYKSQHKNNLKWKNRKGLFIKFCPYKRFKKGACQGGARLLTENGF